MSFRGQRDSKLYKVTAIVLKRLRIGEADFLLTLLTSKRGKIKAVVKGALKTRSKLGGHLELLNHSLLMVAEGKNLDTVTQAETIDSFYELRSDLWRTSLALYISELTDQALPEEVEMDEVLALLLETLKSLCKVTKPELLTRFYEIRLLDLLGYRPQLYKCTNCKGEIIPGKNRFSPASGGILCVTCGNQKGIATSIETDAIKILRFLQNANIEDIERLRISPNLARSVENLLRSYIIYYLEKELKSVKWLDQLRRENI